MCQFGDVSICQFVNLAMCQFDDVIDDVLMRR